MLGLLSTMKKRTRTNSSILQQGTHWYSICKMSTGKPDSPSQVTFVARILMTWCRMFCLKNPNYLCSALQPRTWTCSKARLEDIEVRYQGSNKFRVSFDVSSVLQQRFESDVLLVPTTDSCCPAWHAFLVHRHDSTKRHTAPFAISCIHITRSRKTYVDGTLKQDHMCSQTLEKHGGQIATAVCDQLLPGTTVRLEEQEFVVRSSVLPFPDINFIFITLADVNNFCRGEKHDKDRYACPIKNIVVFGKRQLEENFHVLVDKASSSQRFQSCFRNLTTKSPNHVALTPDQRIHVHTCLNSSKIREAKNTYITATGLQRPREL